jgi:hypothetical protein
MLSMSPALAAPREIENFCFEQFAACERLRYDVAQGKLSWLIA